MTVRQIEDSMSASELHEWMRFYRAEPFGPARDNLHAGIVASTLVNVMTTTKTGKPATPLDFMVGAQQARRERSLREAFAALDARAIRKPKGRKS